MDWNIKAIGIITVTAEVEKEALEQSLTSGRYAFLRQPKGIATEENTYFIFNITADELSHFKWLWLCNLPSFVWVRFDEDKLLVAYYALVKQTNPYFKRKCKIKTKHTYIVQETCESALPLPEASEHTIAGTDFQYTLPMTQIAQINEKLTQRLRTAKVKCTMDDIYGKIGMHGWIYRSIYIGLNIND